jgi:hypothetical protein
VRETELAAAATNICIEIGDVDGDGKRDLISGSADGIVSVYRNLSTPGVFSDRSFAPRVEFRADGRIHDVLLGDFNGDGKPDLALVTEANSRLSIFQNLSAPGSFTAASFGPRLDFPCGSSPQGLTLADVDGDGWRDCVFANYYSGTISICRNAAPFKPVPKASNDLAARRAGGR